MSEGRRYAIVGVVVLAAIVTPPDPISQLMLAVPLVILYEISIWCVRLIELRRKREDEAETVAA
jgi:sec-independent protein translocase protein TatC